MRITLLVLVPTALATILCAALAVCIAAPSEYCNTITERRDRLRHRLDACEAQLPECARNIECRRSREMSERCDVAWRTCEDAAARSKACGKAYADWRAAWAEWLSECESK